MSGCGIAGVVAIVLRIITKVSYDSTPKDIYQKKFFVSFLFDVLYGYKLVVDCFLFSQLGL